MGFPFVLFRSWKDPSLPNNIHLIVMWATSGLYMSTFGFCVICWECDAALFNSCYRLHAFQQWKFSCSFLFFRSLNVLITWAVLFFPNESIWTRRNSNELFVLTELSMCFVLLIAYIYLNLFLCVFVNQSDLPIQTIVHGYI